MVRLSLLRDRLGIETEKVPLALWIFVAISVVSGLVFSGIAVGSLPAFALFAILTPLVLGILILRRSRIVWSLNLLFGLQALVVLPFSPSPWWSVLLSLLGLALLVNPPVLRFIWRDRPERSGQPGRSIPRPQQGVWDFAATESDRRDGWYVDPDNPKRMRYWSSASGEWLGSAKTPRKVRQAWLSEEPS